MSFTTKRRILLPLAAAGIVGLALTACTGDVAAGNKADTDCADYETYGTFDDNPTVSITGSIVDVEADRLIESWKDFSTCTGIEVTYQGSAEFEAQIAVLAEAGNAPDISLVPQPGLLARLAEGGWLKPAPESVEANVDEFWSEDWKAYGTYDGTFYAAPLMASVKGFVWYSPAEFEEKGYEVPTTLDELNELTETIAADSDDKPWCAGFASGDATGWPGTDWVEDYVLRQAGPEVYDQWVTHEIPFNDPQIVEAFDAVGDIIKNPDYVNGGLGDVSSILSTRFQTAGHPLVQGGCSLHHQATFYEGLFPEGTEVGPDGDVYAFILPSVEADGEKAVTGAGEFPVAFNEGEEVDAVRTYLSSDTWANIRVKLGGTISANNGVDPENASSDVLQESIEILQDENTVFRFDGSDLMPAAVGSDSFWKGIVGWVSGDSTQQTVDNIEASWPKS